MKKGVRSFPKYIGIKNSSIVAAFFYIFAIILSFVPFIFDVFPIYYRNIYYILIIILTDVMLMITALQLIFNRDINLKIYRKTTLVAIFIGLVGFLVGALIS
jgi:4-hydroxybenzoate polyprenyltransferase